MESNVRNSETSKEKLDHLCSKFTGLTHKWKAEWDLLVSTEEKITSAEYPDYASKPALDGIKKRAEEWNQNIETLTQRLEERNDEKLVIPTLRHLLILAVKEFVSDTVTEDLIRHLLEMGKKYSKEVQKDRELFGYYKDLMRKCSDNAYDDIALQLLVLFKHQPYE
jgi:hypothetical protein